MSYTDVRRHVTLSVMPPLLLLLLLLPSLTRQEILILEDGIEYYNVTSFTASDLRQLREQRNIVIRDSNIDRLGADTFKNSQGVKQSQGGTGRRLWIINTRIDYWANNQLDDFSEITISDSSIGELASGGVSVHREDTLSCRHARTSTAVRLRNCTIGKLRTDGVVMDVAGGSLSLERCHIGLVEHGGLRTAFRVLLSVTGGEVGQLSAGGLGAVCSDVVQIGGGVRVHACAAPAAAALQLGGECRRQCPRQRLHVRQLGDILLPGEAVEQLAEPLRSCQHGGASAAVCGDLRLAVDRSSCTVSSARLLRLLGPVSWEGGIAITASGCTLLLGFLLGLLCCRCCCRRRPRNAPHAMPLEPQPKPEPEPESASTRSQSPALQRRLRSYQQRISLLWRGTPSQESRQVNVGSVENIYEQLTTPVESQSHVGTTGLPGPEAEPGTGTGTGTGQKSGPRTASRPPQPKPKPHLYANLHLSKRWRPDGSLAT